MYIISLQNVDTDICPDKKMSFQFHPNSFSVWESFVFRGKFFFFFLSRKLTVKVNRRSRNNERFSFLTTSVDNNLSDVSTGCSSPPLCGISCYQLKLSRKRTFHHLLSTGATEKSTLIEGQCVYACQFYI